MKILCVIPSRMQSTRLPKKPLALIQGKPMIQRVYENAARCKILSDVIVATDHQDIANIIQKINGKVIFTDPNLPTGSDRCAVIAKQFPEMDIVINLQGDEPFMRPSMLEKLVEPWLSGESPDMTTLAYPLDLEKNYHSPAVVKVITDQNNNAIYFSRSPIPYFRQPTEVPVYNHVGLYAFRREFLLKYTTLTPTPLEKAEALEQLRALEHGYKIRVCITEGKTLEINTPEELAAAQHFPIENLD